VADALQTHADGYHEEAVKKLDEEIDKIISLNKELQEKMVDDLQQKSNMGLKESAAADDELRAVYDDLHGVEETDVHEADDDAQEADGELRVVYDDLHETEEETDVHEADDDVQVADGDHLESADESIIRQPSSDVDGSAADVLVEGEDKLLEFEIMFGLVQAKDEPLVEDAPHPLLEDEQHGQEAVISYENYDYGELAGQTGNCSMFIHKNIYLEQLKQVVQF
jgi:hypothetical protein